MRKNGFTHESTHNESKEWYTPRYIFDSIGLEFDIDPCSPGKDIVSWIPAKKHLAIFDDGLTSPWNGLAFVNPPYGMDTPKWMKRLSGHGNGIALVFSRTDTQWFHQYAVQADAILFVAKRIQFVPASQAELYAQGRKIKNSGSGAGSMLIGFGEAAYTALIHSDLGSVFVPNDSGDNTYNLAGSRKREMVRDDTNSAGGCSIPNESLPPLSEPSLFNTTNS